MTITIDRLYSKGNTEKCKHKTQMWNYSMNEWMKKIENKEKKEDTSRMCNCSPLSEGRPVGRGLNDFWSVVCMRCDVVRCWRTSWGRRYCSWRSRTVSWSASGSIWVQAARVTYSSVRRQTSLRASRQAPHTSRWWLPSASAPTAARCFRCSHCEL